jgi:hypothetical protein
MGGSFLCGGWLVWEVGCAAFPVLAPVPEMSTYRLVALPINPQTLTRTGDYLTARGSRLAYLGGYVVCGVLTVGKRLCLFCPIDRGYPIGLTVCVAQGGPVRGM